MATIKFVSNQLVFNALTNYTFGSDTIEGFNNLNDLLKGLLDINLKYVPARFCVVSQDKVEFLEYNLSFSVWYKIVSNIHTAINDGADRFNYANILLPMFYGKFYANFINFGSANMSYWNANFAGNRLAPFNFGFIPNVPPISFNGVDGISNNASFADGVNSYTIYDLPEGMSGQTGTCFVQEINVSGYFANNATSIFTIGSGYVTGSINATITPATTYWAGIGFQIWPQPLEDFYIANIGFGVQPTGQAFASIGGAQNVWSIISA